MRLLGERGGPAIAKIKKFSERQEINAQSKKKTFPLTKRKKKGP
jgi:hypothetical protein